MSAQTFPSRYSIKDRKHLPKLSDAESLQGVPEEYFSSTSYNSYLESGTMIRVDTLFKPLLRRFRDYFRTRFNSRYDRRNHSRWPISKHVQLVETFMSKELALPHELLDQENTAKMMTLLFPQSKIK